MNVCIYVFTKLCGFYCTWKVREIPDDAMTSRHIPFEVPLGDRTLIILGQSSSDEEATKAPDTLYKAVKTLMKANQGAELKLAGMGSLTAQTTAAGKHGYEIEFPKGHAQYVPYAFELKAEQGADKKATSGNFFLKLAGPHGISGSMSLCWKCSHKPVFSKVAPTKPFIITNTALNLVKGQPMLLGGPSEH